MISGPYKTPTFSAIAVFSSLGNELIPIRLWLTHIPCIPLGTHEFTSNWQVIRNRKVLFYRVLGVELYWKYRTPARTSTVDLAATSIALVNLELQFKKYERLYFTKTEHLTQFWDSEILNSCEGVWCCTVFCCCWLTAPLWTDTGSGLPPFSTKWGGGVGMGLELAPGSVLGALSTKSFCIRSRSIVSHISWTKVILNPARYCHTINN